jgi:hypothetical protein
VRFRSSTYRIAYVERGEEWSSTFEHKNAKRKELHQASTKILRTEMQQQDQQQARISCQQQPLHRGVLSGIARLANPRYREERHKLLVWSNGAMVPMDRHSLHHLVEYLDNHRDAHDEVVITELELHSIRLSHPSDGGMDVLRRFFSRSSTTVYKSRAVEL